MFRPQITLIPVALLICDADFTLVYVGCRRIVLRLHQSFVGIISEKQFSGLRDIYDSVSIAGNLRIGIVSIIHFFNLIFRKWGRSSIICRQRISIRPHLCIDSPIRIGPCHKGNHRYYIIAACSLAIHTVIICQPDTMDIHGRNIILINTTIIRIIIICRIDVKHFPSIHTGKQIQRILIQLLRDGIIPLLLRQKAQRRIRPISGEHVSSREVRIPGGVDFVRQELELLQDGPPVSRGEVGIGPSGALGRHIGDDVRQLGQGVLGNLDPALGIGNVLAVILGYLRHIAAEPQGADGHHGILGGTVYLLLGGHLGAQFVLVHLVGIDVGQIVALHDFIRYSHRNLLFLPGRAALGPESVSFKRKCRA